MPPRTWDEGVVTGVQTMDADHRLQASLIDAFEALLRRKDDIGLAEKTIARLLDFTSVHFLTEELLMQHYGYPKLDGHKAEHARLLERAAEISKKIGSGEGAALDELRKWLVDHIRSMDQAFALWCSENRVRLV
jgi:hemerythrin